MGDASPAPAVIAHATIDLLEARLKRIQYVVAGHLDIADEVNHPKTVSQRLAELEQSLHRLTSKSKVTQDLVRLHSRYPDLFQPSNPSEPPSILDTEAIASTILACASSYHLTASQLSAIADLPVPPAETSTKIIELAPRLAKDEMLQQAQSQDIAKLQQRTAALLQRWYAINILSGGECWAELTDRVEHVERRVRRLAREREEEMKLTT